MSNMHHCSKVLSPNYMWFMSFYVQDPQVELNTRFFFEANAFQDILCTDLFDVTILKRRLLLALLQDKGDFELATLPALVPVFTSASGETLLLLVKHADLIINKVIRVTCEISIDYIIPLCYLCD